MNPKKPQKPVYVYLIILFAVALLLMVISLAMNNRNHQQTLRELQDSSTHLKNYMEQVETLEKRVEALEKSDTEHRAALTEQENENRALAWLASLEYCFAAKDYAACRTLLADMESFLSYLPEVNSVDSSLPSPAERCRAIAEKVNP